MSNENYSWTCSNISCGATQEIPRQRVLESIKKGRKVALVCAICGYISIGSNASPGEMDNAYKCVPWMDSVQRQPLGFTSGGWVSAQGEAPIDEKRYMARHGVNPRINFEWRKKSIKA